MVLSYGPEGIAREGAPGYATSQDLGQPLHGISMAGRPQPSSIRLSRHQRSVDQPSSTSLPCWGCPAQAHWPQASSRNANTGGQEDRCGREGYVHCGTLWDLHAQPELSAATSSQSHHSKEVAFFHASPPLIPSLLLPQECQNAPFCWPQGTSQDCAVPP